MTKLTDIAFEPHPGFGTTDPFDGEPFPFGYISGPGPVPIFELSPILEYDAADLTELAQRIVRAVNSQDDTLAALKEAHEFMSNFLESDDPRWIKVRAAISKAQKGDTP